MGDEQRRRRQYQVRLTEPLPSTAISRAPLGNDDDDDDVFSQCRYLKCILVYLTDKSWACRDSEEVVRNARKVLAVAEWFGYLYRLLQGLAEREADATASREMVLRNDSLRITMFVEVAKEGFGEWLGAASRKAFAYIRKVHVLTPDHYYAALEMLLQRISRSTHALPPAVLLIIRVTYGSFVGRFSGDMVPANRALHSILFLRLICPMLQAIHLAARPVAARRRKKTTTTTSLLIPPYTTKLTKCLLILVNRLTDENITLCAELKVEPIERLGVLEGVLENICSRVAGMVGFGEPRSASAGYDSDYDDVVPSRYSKCSLVTRRSMSDSVVVGAQAFCSSTLAKQCREYKEMCRSIGMYILRDSEEFKRSTPSPYYDDIIRQVRASRSISNMGLRASRSPSFYGADECRRLYGVDRDDFKNPYRMCSYSLVEVTFEVLCDESALKKLFKRMDASSSNSIVIHISLSSSSCRYELLTNLNYELEQYKLSENPFRLYDNERTLMDCSLENAALFEEHFRGCADGSTRAYRMKICFCLLCR